MRAATRVGQLEPAAAEGNATPLPRGARIGHLSIEAVLNEGPYTTTYRVTGQGLRTESLALMEYFPRAIAVRQRNGRISPRHASQGKAFNTGREAFLREAAMLERLAQPKPHPHLVPVLGSLGGYDTVYRVMRLLEGRTLAQQTMVDGIRISAAEVLQVLRAGLDALEQMHAAGLVHGNVRPEQIFITHGGVPVLMGPGLTGLALDGRPDGPWRAPEQGNDGSDEAVAGPAADLHQLALTAWFAVAGQVPPPASQRAADPLAWQPAEALAEVRDEDCEAPGLSRRLAAGILPALANDPGQRPPNAAAMRELLQPATRLEDDLASPTAEPAAGSDAVGDQAPSRGWSLWWLGAAAAAAALAWIVLRTPGGDEAGASAAETGAALAQGSQATPSALPTAAAAPTVAGAPGTAATRGAAIVAGPANAAAGDAMAADDAASAASEGAALAAPGGAVSRPSTASARSPRSACQARGARGDSALQRCVRELCARAAYRAHAQCAPRTGAG